MMSFLDSILLRDVYVKSCVNWWAPDELQKFNAQAGAWSCLNSWSLGRCLFWPSCSKGTNVGGRVGMHSCTETRWRHPRWQGPQLQLLSLVQPVLPLLCSSFLQVICVSQKGSHCPCTLLRVETELNMILFLFWNYWLHFPCLYFPGCFSWASMSPLKIPASTGVIRAHTVHSRLILYLQI